MLEFSVVIIIKGRRKQLANLLQSIRASDTVPNDIQIVCMDDVEGITKPDALNVIIHLIKTDHQLPLAAARNMGMTATRTDNVIFVDVDCIVSPTLFANMLLHLQADKIIAAYPLYLPLLPATGDYNDLLHKAVAHPSREQIPVGQPVHHLQFWSLIFAIEKKTFEKTGGFDTSFSGYGAEDTDFAMMFHQQGIEQIFVPDYVLHQYHQKHDPPLNHFEDIITNAVRYQEKWNVLPMRRWLNGFEDMGLIKIDQASKISVLKKPTPQEILNSVSPHPY